MSAQPEALRLAQALELIGGDSSLICQQSAVELRRLHEQNQELLGALQSMVVAFHPPMYELEDADDDYLMTWFPAWAKGRAAIAKATGGAA